LLPYYVSAKVSKKQKIKHKRKLPEPVVQVLSSSPPSPSYSLYSLTFAVCPLYPFLKMKPCLAALVLWLNKISMFNPPTPPRFFFFKVFYLESAKAGVVKASSFSKLRWVSLHPVACLYQFANFRQSPCL
jgi:hypothetical protein